MLRITCSACDGARDDCPTCDGTGREPRFRCPSSHNTLDLAQAMRCMDLLEVGVLPSRGAWLEQTAAFGAFVRIASAERAAVEIEAEQERDRLQRKLGGRRGG